MEWDPGKHPRGQGGRFAHSASSSAKESVQSLIPKDSYINSDEYRKAYKGFNEGIAARQLLRAQRKQAQEEIDKECPVLPYEEWSEEDQENADLLGKRDFISMGLAPRKNPQKYAKLREQMDSLAQQESDNDAQIDLSSAQLQQMRQQEHDRQVASWKGADDLAAYNGEEIPGFRTDTTGVPYYDDLLKRGKGVIVTMSPKSYLEYCAYRIFDKATIESTVSAVDTENAERYAKQMSEGQQFNMPYLNFVSRQQEGRHRAIAAMVNGQDKIPVFCLTGR